MKQLCFIFFLAIVPFSLFGQAERDSVDIYCTITTRIPGFGKSQTRVDYGKKGINQELLPLHTEDGPEAERESFETMTEAMNYLSARGWKYVVMFGSPAIDGGAVAKYCLMRKRVPVSGTEGK